MISIHNGPLPFNACKWVHCAVGSRSKNEYYISCYTGTYHLQCYMGGAVARRVSTTSEVAGWNRCSKPDEVCKILFPHLVKDELRAKLKLTKDIDKMNGRELRLELLKRDLESCGSKAKLTRRLREYLNCAPSTCTMRQSRFEARQQLSEMMAIGFCRRAEKRYGINMPLYLKQIVNKYCGMFEY